MGNREMIQADQTTQSSHCKELTERKYRRTPLSQDTIVWATTCTYSKQNRLLTPQLQGSQLKSNLKDLGQSALSIPEEGLLQSDSIPFQDGFLEIR